MGQAEVLREGEDLLFVGFGPITMRAMEVADVLAAEGWSIGVVNARFAKPLDRELIIGLARGKRLRPRSRRASSRVGSAARSSRQSRRPA